MRIVTNPHRGKGLDHPALAALPWPAHDASRALALIARCPRAGATPLTAAPELAAQAGVGALWIKDESARMGLGSFKALGAAHVIARDAEAGRAAGRIYVAATAGNHGLSVAAGAAAFGATARIFIAETVPESFAERLRELGAEVVRAGAVYEESLEAAMEAAKAPGAELLSDTSWDAYVERPHVLMEGYLIFMAEIGGQIDRPPTHIFLQAGVGGLACAGAAWARANWGRSAGGDGPIITVVEPEVAPALVASIEAGGPVVTEGPASDMGRLDCKEPSWIALKGLARDADHFVTLSEAEAAAGLARVEAAGFPSSTSGAAGLIALLEAGDRIPGLGPDARVLAILSEGPA